MAEKKPTRTAHWNKYAHEHYKFFTLKVRNTDSAILDKLASVESKNGYILDLIRKDIEKEKE